MNLLKVIPPYLLSKYDNGDYKRSREADLIVLNYLSKTHQRKSKTSKTSRNAGFSQKLLK